MKKSLRLLLIAFIILTLTVAFSIVVSADETPVKQYSLTYMINDSSCNNQNHDHNGIKYYDEGTEVVVSSTLCGGGVQGGETFFGWFSDDGVLYKAGEKITMTRNTILYIAVGKNVSTAAELKAYLNDTDDGNYWNYARLTADLTLNNQTIQGNWGGCAVGVLDLNGHTINTSGLQFASGDQRTGMIFTGKGTINFTSNKPLEGAFFTTRPHGWGDGAQRLWIGKDVKIVSNAPLIRLTHSMTSLSGKPTIRIYGDITAPFILWSHGAFDIDVHLYETCKITVPAGAKQALIYDSSNELGFTIASLIIHGGTFNLPEDFKGFVTTIDGEPDNRLTYKINGGTFNRDLSTIIPISLRVQDNGNGTFSILPNPCSKAPEGSNGLHRYVATKIGVDCVTSGKITYSCIYCLEAGCDTEGGTCFCEYEVKREAFGHSFISVLTQDMVVTKRETKVGISTMTCTRCGITETSYEYPDPNRVYITLKVRYKRTDASGVEQEYVENIRVPSEKVFGFKADPTYGNDLTYIYSYSVFSLEYEFDDGRKETFKQNEVVGVEIPLGTTKIQKGLFKGNEDIEWIRLREGLMYIEDEVFSHMPKLSRVEGIEFVEDYIGTSAFYQDDSAEPKLILDTLKVNAKDVGASAFRNVLATRVIIGDNVRRLKDAFRLDGNTSKYENNNDIVKEIFIEKINKHYAPDENPDMYGIAVAELPRTIWTTLFEEFSYTSTLLARGTFYADHKFDNITHMPNCKENGYIAHECVQCGLHEVLEILYNTGITHTWVDADPIKSTCSVAGYNRQYCERCDSYKNTTELPLDPNKHDFTSTDPEPTVGACTSTNWDYRRRCAYGCGTYSKNIYKKGDGIILGHVYSNDPNDIKTIPPTCTTPGKTFKTCTRCGEENELGDTIPVVPHSWISTLQESATCKTPAKYLSRCSVCELTEVIEEKNADGTLKIPTYEEAEEKGLHKWVETVIVEPTTESTGYKSIKCSICNKSKKGANTTIPKLSQAEANRNKAILIASIVGGVVLVGGGIFVLVFLLTKKKNKSTGYKYKFNTFKK